MGLASRPHRRPGELDAAISTAELADAPRSLAALRAATQALDDEIEVVRGVTQEQLRANGGSA
ncbi:hypothetical protein SAMN02745244_00394 [Tessaracoccus bendigoensis DSM 12906]|uniref:Uncharacterized protein n=1 Tax=Tessaracoccus bendigoensis DSM 12906 TaxID=1123357 RepID=A0A1M6BA45_9ACTN|nr:hypothetical protein [Tessaracoccus bendigoensis]SHI45611.1 hypothetical protein SAMN02745244_00394 [Tessaracoccus bendigoensis DSM 12906]